MAFTVFSFEYEATSTVVFTELSFDFFFFFFFESMVLWFHESMHVEFRGLNQPIYHSLNKTDSVQEGVM